MATSIGVRSYDRRIDLDLPSSNINVDRVRHPFVDFPAAGRGRQSLTGTGRGDGASAVGGDAGHGDVVVQQVAKVPGETDSDPSPFQGGVRPR